MYVVGGWQNATIFQKNLSYKFSEEKDAEMFQLKSGCI